MFIIFGFGKRKGGEMTVYDNNGRRYIIFYIANYFSLFFIPLINTSKVFFISKDGRDMEITKDEYNQMKSGGFILHKFENMSNNNSDFNQGFNETCTDEKSNVNYANEVCPVCKNKLEKSFAFCPYCGQKQPRA